MNTNNENKLLVVDGNSVLYRGFYALPLLSNRDGLYTNAVYGFLNIFIKAIKDISPTHVVVAFDYGKKTFRNELFSEYKITRKKTPDELIMQFPIIKEVLSSMKIKYIEIEGFEGDDIIGSISKKFKDVQTIVLSGDRDTFQLIDDTTKILYSKKGVKDVELYDKDFLMEQKGITPSQVVDVKALMGDVSDNIPGVAGIGEISAYKLVKEYGSLDKIYEQIDTLSGKLKEKLVSGKDMAYLSHKLGSIKTDCDINFSLEDFILHFPFGNEFYKTCKKYDFSSILKNTTMFSKDADKESVTNSTGIEEVSQEDFDSLIMAIKDKKCFAFDLTDTYMQVCIGADVVKQITFKQDLLSSGYAEEDVILAFKDVFEDKSICKKVYDAKNVKKKLKKFAVELNNFDDVALMFYLLTASDKPFESQDFCDKFNLSSLVQAIFVSHSELDAEINKRGLSNLYQKIEKPLVDVLLYMEECGVKIDIDKVIAFEKEVAKQIEQEEAIIHSYIGDDININSPKQLGVALYDNLNIVVPNNKKKSTAVEVLSKIEYMHPVISHILKYRALVKIKSTYLDAYLQEQKNGFIYTHFLQMVTGTGRLSSKEPNLQNIPVRDASAKEIREAFVSRFENGYILSFDYDQIELKLMAHLSQDEHMLQTFNNGEDIHAMVASKIYGVSKDDVSEEQRRKAKSVNFGIMYGQGAYGLSENLNISVKEAKDFIENYFAIFPKVKLFTEKCVQKAKELGYAESVLGRQRNISELSSSNFQIRNFGERVAVNMPLQGSASDIIKIAMINVYNQFIEHKLQSKMILQVHDELVFDVQQNEVDIVKDIVINQMQNAIKLSVPLTVSASVSRNFNKEK